MSYGNANFFTPTPATDRVTAIRRLIAAAMLQQAPPGQQSAPPQGPPYIPSPAAPPIPNTPPAPIQGLLDPGAGYAPTGALPIDQPQDTVPPINTLASDPTQTPANPSALYKLMTQVQPPTLAAAPTRNRKREAATTAIGALVSLLLGGDSRLQAANGFMQGSEAGYDANAADAQAQVKQANDAALQQYGLQRQRVDDTNQQTTQQFQMDQANQAQRDRVAKTAAAQTAAQSTALADLENRLVGASDTGKQSILKLEDGPDGTGLVAKYGRAFPRLADGTYDVSGLTKADPAGTKTPQEIADANRIKRLTQEKQDIIREIGSPKFDVNNYPARAARYTEVDKALGGPGTPPSLPLSMSPAEKSAADSRKAEYDFRVQESKDNDYFRNENLKMRRAEFKASQAAKAAGGGNAEKAQSAAIKAAQGYDSNVASYNQAIESRRPKPKLVKDATGNSSWQAPSDEETQAFNTFAQRQQQLVADAQDAKARVLANVRLKPDPAGKGGYAPMTGNVDTSQVNPNKPTVQHPFGTAGWQPVEKVITFPKSSVQQLPKASVTTRATTPASSNGPLAPAPVNLHHSATQPRTDDGKFNGPPASAPASSVAKDYTGLSVDQIKALPPDQQQIAIDQLSAKMTHKKAH